MIASQMCISIAEFSTCQAFMVLGCDWVLDLFIAYLCLLLTVMMVLDVVSGNKRTPR